MISERFTARLIEAGERLDEDGHEFVLEVDGTRLHIPCTLPVVREAAAHLYEWFEVDLRLTPRPREHP